MSAIHRTGAHQASPLDLGEFLEEHGDRNFVEEVDYRSGDAVPGGCGCSTGGGTMDCQASPMVAVNADPVAAPQRKS